MSGTPDITELLHSWGDGNEAALGELMPLVYADLRRIAASHVRREARHLTIEPTGLVHEAYLRLIDQTRARWNDRQHFYSVVARIIRHILVDLARARGADKRGGGAVTVQVDEALLAAEAPDLDVLVLDECLEALARLDARQARIIELRFFCGLSIEETAGSIGCSPATVKREWAVARAWLFREIGRRRQPGRRKASRRAGVVAANLGRVANEGLLTRFDFLQGSSEPRVLPHGLRKGAPHLDGEGAEIRLADFLRVLRGQLPRGRVGDWRSNIAIPAMRHRPDCGNFFNDRTSVGRIRAEIPRHDACSSIVRQDDVSSPALSGAQGLS